VGLRTGYNPVMPSSKLTSPNRRHFLLAAAAAAPAFTLHAQEDEESAKVGKLPPAIAGLKPRVHEAVPITLAEREGRLEHARALMKAKQMDAVIITVGTSLNYFSGLKVGYQSERLFAWILPASGAPFVVCPAFEEGRIREGLTMAPDGAATKIHTWNEDASPYDLVARSLKERGLAAGTVGIEERTQFAFADGMAHATPALKVVNGTPITAGCRMAKSAAELALMQLANDITLSVYEAAYRSAKVGMTNREFTGLIAAGYERSGVRGEASCQVGKYSALPHGSVQPQVIREGEIILIDDGCSVEGYQSDISRTFVLGKPTDKQKKVFEIVHRAQAAALAAARPGVECQAIDKAARDVVDAAGFGPDYKHFTHRVGHGIGMDGHEWPYLVRGNATKLEAGMCFSDEPGIYIEGEFGVRLEDDWYVTPDGGKMFTPTSLSLEDPFGKG
jgi:Xaa-Pro dipeptidase